MHARALAGRLPEPALHLRPHAHAGQAAKDLLEVRLEQGVHVEQQRDHLAIAPPQIGPLVEEDHARELDRLPVPLGAGAPIRAHPRPVRRSDRRVRDLREVDERRLRAVQQIGRARRPPDPAERPSQDAVGQVVGVVHLVGHEDALLVDGGVRSRVRAHEEPAAERRAVLLDLAVGAREALA